MNMFMKKKKKNYINETENSEKNLYGWNKKKGKNKVKNRM